MIRLKGKIHISNHKAVNDPGFGLAKEAIRVLENSPKWKPANQNGRNILYRKNIAISFEVK